MVDPVTRAISCSQQAVPTQSDASKVVAKGLGLTKGFIGQKNSFSVDCSKAGVYGGDVSRCSFGDMRHSEHKQRFLRANMLEFVEE